VLGRGRLISETSVEDFTDHAAGGVLVRTPETGRLGQVLAARGVTVINDGTDLLRVSGTTAEQIGAAAWRAHLPVYELTPTHASLEEAFMQVTKDSIEYHPAASTPPRYGRPSPAASKTSSPVSPPACPTARSRPACSCRRAR
jgi:ABC-2 type transport system ATP-binding protein